MRRERPEVSLNSPALLLQGSLPGLGEEPMPEDPSPMPQPRASLPEPRDREKQCVPSSVVQRTPHPKGRREAWAIIQGLPLTDDLGRVPFPARASVSQSAK